MTDTQGNTKFLWILMALSVAAGIFGSVLFTEVGQILNLPSDWLYAVYPHLGWVSILVFVIALYVLAQHFRSGLLRRRLVMAYVVVIAGTIFVTNFFVPEVWLRGHHHTATFISVLEADDLLAICIQHEIDHLEGKVFVDYLSPLKRNRIRKQLKKMQRGQE